MKKTGLFIFMLLILAQTSIVRADFTRTSEGIVKDSVTKLEWQDSYPDNSDGVMEYANWDPALSYCNELDLDGSGWRLPNINELKTLIVDTQFSPAISRVFTVSNDNGGLYSSTTFPYNNNYRYAIGITNGRIFSYSGKVGVRCVRDGS